MREELCSIFGFFVAVLLFIIVAIMSAPPPPSAQQEAEKLMVWIGDNAACKHSVVCQRRKAEMNCPRCLMGFY